MGIAGLVLIASLAMILGVFIGSAVTRRRWEKAFYSGMEKFAKSIAGLHSILGFVVAKGYIDERAALIIWDMWTKEYVRTPIHCACGHRHLHSEDDTWVDDNGIEHGVTQCDTQD